MEAAAHGGGGGGAEVRRLHIVYFLSRKGRIEHPHLVRVHHLSRNGVRLRDIKRWLGEIRGKDMPESFSWSYKRRYKTGYVWQDLMDDDLITPISDNEYVLKGSEIASTIIKEEKSAQQMDQKALLSKEENHSHSSETSVYMSTKSSEIEEEESPTSTLTDDSGEIEMDKGKHENPSPEEKTQRSSTFYSALLSKKNKKKSNSNNKVKFEEKVSVAEAADSLKTSTTPSSSSEPHLTKSKSSSNGGSNIFRNLITCGAVETNDSAVVAVNKQNSNNNNKPFLSMCSSDLENVYSAELCKRDRIGGSQRVFGTPNWTQEKWGGRKSFDGVKESVKNKNESKEQKANDKQVNWPHCSQCGKPFKPEKLHSHMKSCKGMKALKKENAAISAAAAAEKASRNKISGIQN